MSDELTREQVVEQGEDIVLSNSYIHRLAVWCNILSHDAALRASREVERERAEKAERHLACYQTGEVLIATRIRDLESHNADLTAKLKAALSDARSYQEDWQLEVKLHQEAKNKLAASEARVKELEQQRRTQ